MKIENINIVGNPPKGSIEVDRGSFINHYDTVWLMPNKGSSEALWLTSAQADELITALFSTVKLINPGHGDLLLYKLKGIT